MYKAYFHGILLNIFFLLFWLTKYILNRMTSTDMPTRKGGLSPRPSTTES